MKMGSAAVLNDIELGDGTSSLKIEQYEERINITLSIPRLA